MIGHRPDAAWYHRRIEPLRAGTRLAQPLGIIGVVGDVAVLPGLRRPPGFGTGGGADARQAMADIERVRDLALLAVAHAVDAERDLFGDDLAHRLGETGGEGLLVDCLAALACFE